MSKFTMETSSETPYLYVKQKCSMDPDDISKNMEIAFTKTMEFMQSHGICPAGPALSVYYTHSETELEFRAGFVVTEDDLAKADGNVKGDKTPATTVLTYTHKGPYRTLRNTYEEMMAYLEGMGKKVSAPTWEFYVSDPDSTPEDELCTDLHVAIT